MNGWVHGVEAEVQAERSDIGDAVGHGFIHERTVGHQLQGELPPLCCREYVSKIVPGKDLAAGQGQEEATHIRELVEHVLDLRQRQFALPVAIGRIAMNAREIAPVRQLHMGTEGDMPVVRLL